MKNKKKYKIIGLVEREKTKNNKFADYPILGNNKDLEKIKKKCSNIFIAIGQIKNLSLRSDLFRHLIFWGFRLPVVISPKAHVSKKTKINIGSIVMHKAVVNSATEIGLNCIINSNSLVEHGAKIGNHTHISTGAIINGDCKVGNNSFIGSGSIIKEGVRIGDRCIIGMGQIVKKDIKDNKIVK